MAANDRHPILQSTNLPEDKDVQSASDVNVVHHQMSAAADGRSAVTSSNAVSTNNSEDPFTAESEITRQQSLCVAHENPPPLDDSTTVADNSCDPPSYRELPLGCTDETPSFNHQQQLQQQPEHYSVLVDGSRGDVTPGVDAEPEELFTRNVALSCIVFWLCGFAFGFVAYLLAINAQNRVRTNVKMARNRARASLAVSTMGIIAGALVLTVSLAVFYGRPVPRYCSNSSYVFHRKCYMYRSPSNSCQYFSYNFDDNVYGGSTYDCRTSDYGRVAYDDEFCYYNCSCCSFSVDGKCYNYRSDRYYNYNYDCSHIGGDAYASGSYCYHNCLLGMYEIGGQCYGNRSTSYNHSSCFAAFGTISHYNGTYCYYNCSAGFFLAGGNCYRYVALMGSSCRSGGYYGTTYYKYPYCYHSCSSGLYEYGNSCFKNKVHLYDENGNGVCQSSYGGQGGLALFDSKRNYCYYNCSNWQFSVGDECFDYRAENFSSSSSCSSAFPGTTYYDPPYCYHV